MSPPSHAQLEDQERIQREMTEQTGHLVLQGAYETLPPILAQMPWLTHLDMTGVGLLSLPEDIDTILPNIEELLIFDNQIESIPDSIGQLKQLRMLDISINPLTTLPASVGMLQNLRSLFVGTCSLQTLPAELGQCRSLQQLHAENNQINTIPASLQNLRGLRPNQNKPDYQQGLRLDENPFTGVPASVFALDPAPMIAAILQIQQTGSLSAQTQQTAQAAQTEAGLQLARRYRQYDQHLQYAPICLSLCRQITRAPLREASQQIAAHLQTIANICTDAGLLCVLALLVEHEPKYVRAEGGHFELYPHPILRRNRYLALGQDYYQHEVAVDMQKGTGHGSPFVILDTDDGSIRPASSSLENVLAFDAAKRNGDDI